MNDRDADLDLLADHVIQRIEGLCGEAVRHALRDEACEACSIEPNAVHADGGRTYEWAKQLYADGLLDDVFKHMATRWGQFRATDRRLRAAAPPMYDEEGDFEP